MESTPEPSIQNQTTTNQESCPTCGKNTVRSSHRCLSIVLENHTQINAEADYTIDGKYCAAEDCEWFKLQRAPEKATTDTHFSSESRVSSHTNSENQGIIKLNRERTVPILDEDVNLIGDKAIYTSKNNCPECGSDIKVVSKRDTTNESKSETSDVYYPIVEKCTNHGKTGDSCNYYFNK